MKRLNPLTDAPFLKGDVREDGFIFNRYVIQKLRQNGTFEEQWLAPAASMRDRVRRSAYAAARRCKESGVLFDVDAEYLLDIYPSDGLCPVLKTPMVFGGGDAWNSPSLDRLVPEKGYVRGNLCWISNKANTIKQDITDPAVFLAIADYVRGCTTQHTIEVHK